MNIDELIAALETVKQHSLEKGKTPVFIGVNGEPQSDEILDVISDANGVTILAKW